MLAKALTIAGSDSGGGAGIQADLKTFAALDVYGTSAITAITAQNTCGVSAVQGIDPDVVAAQIRAVVADIGVGAAKTGMLFSAEIIQAVALTVRSLGLHPLVVDPVMVATSGDRLLQREAEESMRRAMLPLATVVTPNLA
ncbi:MAG TPA: bifunctional hydroxymethylpyrimidine kinase/phosphomethylpyrimidine kinase, partial [Candidatus Tectomicrobia bacterium]